MNTTTAVALKENRFADIVCSVGMHAKDLIDRPPISMLAKLEDMPSQIEKFLAAQILQLAGTVNINPQLNIQKYQIPVIAQHLIENYPVESLEDFVLCFKRGGAGFYGSIYRLDAAVLCEWMAMYLDEKYQALESKVKEEQAKHTEENQVNYEKFKERVGDLLKQEKVTNEKQNEYQRQKLATPYKYYDVRGLQIYARSQEHAEELVQKLIQLGEVEEVKE
jgi:hypothetical protein